MLQHGILHCAHILGLDPILGGLTKEALAVTALVFGGMVATESGVNV